MPELPEVETVMRGLAARLQGHTIRAAQLNRADLRWAIPPALASAMQGARVDGFRRRGKYILMRLAGESSVLLHLGMSGRVTIAPHGQNSVARHEHLVLTTDDGWRIALVDPRRFGCLDLLPTAEEDRHRLLAALGPEPLEPDFSAAVLMATCASRRTAIKATLLDQRVVAGLGNIYVCEALFRAKIDPRMPSMQLNVAQAGTLAAAIRSVLTEAIAAGGSSLRDYAQPNGELGYFQKLWQVYGREAAPCPDCPGLPRCAGVQRISQSGRSTFFCAMHQA